MQCACAAKYYNLCPVWLYHISLHYLIKGKIFNLKCVFWYSLQFLSETFLGTFAKLRKAIISFMSVHRRITRFPLKWFAWNLIFEYFSKICRESSCLIKIWQEQRALHSKTNILLRMRNIHVGIWRNICCIHKRPLLTYWLHGAESFLRS